jgi:hypothetical protein
LDGLSAQDLGSFAELQRRAAAIADDYTRTLKERVAQLHQQGLSDGDIGQLLGLTKQRIQQVRPKTGREARQSA